MSSPLLPSAHLSFANVLFVPIKPEPNCIQYPGRQLTLNLLNPKLLQESHTMDGFVVLPIKWVLNCMSFPAVKVVFHLLNRKLPKQDCLTMPEYTKRIYVFVSSIKPQPNCIWFSTFNFRCFPWAPNGQISFCKMASKSSIIPLGEPLGNPSPSGNPRGTHPHPQGTLGEPIPIPGELSGNPSPGNLGEPSGFPNLKSRLKSQISIQKCMKTIAFCYDLQSHC